MAEKTGLVLEGGGMRGIYTAGVLDVFLEHQINFDGVIGVSAGALHGSSYLSGQAGRSIRYGKKYCRDKRFMSWHNFFTTGDLVGEKFCYHELPEKLDPYDFEAFERSGTEFYVTCSNLETGKAEYFRITDMKKQVDLIRASASMPYVSRIVKADGKKLLDGGCTDSIPYLAFARMGFTRQVVVLTRQRGYVKQPENAGLPELYYHRYPEFAKVLSARHFLYNRSVKHLEQLEQEGKVFVIRPGRTLHISRTERDPVKLQEVYDIGRADALIRLDALRNYLNETHPVNRNR